MLHTAKLRSVGLFFVVVQGYISISKQRLFCKGKRGKADEFIYSTASVAYITHHIVPSFSSRLMVKQADQRSLNDLLD